MKKIFFSYRRDDSRWPARQIYDAFARVLPHDRLFMDIDSIPLGADFVDVLKGWVNICDVLLALIGRDWINAIDPKTGCRRLDSPVDFVRIEIREALGRGIPVVPVLLDGASMPSPEQLPQDMRNLARRQAEIVDFRTFAHDVERLIAKLGFTVPKADKRLPLWRSWLPEFVGTTRRSALAERPSQEMPMPSSIQVLDSAEHAEPKSDVHRFFEERLEASGEDSLTSTELYEAYMQWCDDNGKAAFPHPRFVREVAELGVRRERIAKRTRYFGIRLRPAIAPNASARSARAGFHQR
jgi:hypothetical protein